MNDEDDLDLVDDFNEDEASSASPTSKTRITFDSRRRLEERLDAVRVKKQTNDYDFDLD